MTDARTPDTLPEPITLTPDQIGEVAAGLSYASPYYIRAGGIWAATQYGAMNQPSLGQVAVGQQTLAR